MATSTENLAVLVRTEADKATRDMHDYGDSIDDVGDSAKKLEKRTDGLNRKTNIFGKAMLFVQVRMTALLFLTGLLTTAFIVFLPAITSVTAALVALGGLLLPILLVGAGAMMFFSAESKVAGTQAFELAKALSELKQGFLTMIGPAANIVLGAFVDLIHAVLPALILLQGPLEIFAQFFAAGLRAMGPQLVALVPLLSQLFTAAGPAVFSMLQLLVPLTAAFVSLATQGMPLLAAMFDWLVKAAIWLVHAIQAFENWKHTAAGQEAMTAIVALVAAMGHAFKYLAIDIGKLLKAMGPAFLAFIRALTWLFRALGDVLKSDVGPYLVGLLAGLYVTSKMVKLLDYFGKLIERFKAWRALTSGPGGGKTALELWPNTGRPRNPDGSFGPVPVGVPSGRTPTPDPKKPGGGGFFGGLWSKGKGLFPKLLRGSGYVGAGLLARDVLKQFDAINQYSGSAGWGELMRDIGLQHRAGPRPVGAPAGAAGDIGNAPPPIIVHNTILMPNGEVLAKHTTWAAKKDKARR